MSEMKFTKGPWSYELSDRLSDGSDCLSISDADGSSIAEMMCPADVEEANARLIAAAPDLYAALKDVRDFLRSSGYDTRLVDAALALASIEGNAK